MASKQTFGPCPFCDAKHMAVIRDGQHFYALCPVRRGEVAILDEPRRRQRAKKVRHGK